MDRELLKYLIWTFGELEPEYKQEPTDYLSAESDPEFNKEQNVLFSAKSPTSNYQLEKSIQHAPATLATLNGLSANEFFFEEILSQFNREFEIFFSKLVNRVDFPEDQKNLNELKNSIYNFYLYLILPDVKTLIEEKKIARQNGNKHPEIKKLLTKIFFLTSLTYEVMSGNIESLRNTFNRIPGKKIKENRLLSYILVTRLVESEGFSERLSVRKLSESLSLFDEENNDIDYDKYENFVKAYNKWKNENSQYYDTIVEDIRNGASDDHILQKIRTLSLN